MSKYPKIITDVSNNTPTNMTAKISVEDYHDIMHHTHNISDIINAGNGDGNSVVAYDDTELRKLIESKTKEISDKVVETSNRVSKLESKEKYRIENIPGGTLVRYREDEIRVMCSSNTKWDFQKVGETGNENMYYMSFKAYAPEDAVSFKEGDRGVIIDEMFTFDDKFAGVDKDGRKYSICWLALASYNKDTNTWIYFGNNSSTKKYIGWDYVVEWYDAEGAIINADSIRINLSNENCHYVNEPYYVSKLMSEIEELKEKIK